MITETEKQAIVTAYGETIKKLWHTYMEAAAAGSPQTGLIRFMAGIELARTCRAAAMAALESPEQKPK